MKEKFTLIESEIPEQLELLVHNQNARSVDKQKEVLKLYQRKVIYWIICRFDSNQIEFQDIFDDDDFGSAPQYIIPKSSVDQWFTSEMIMSFLNCEDFTDISYTPKKGDLISFSSLFKYKPLKKLPRSEPRFNVMNLSYSSSWTLDSFLRMGNAKELKKEY